MDVKKTLAAIAAGLALAGPLLERFAVEELPIVKTITAGVRTLLEIAERLEEGAEDYSQLVDELVAEFRQLQAEGGVGPDELRAKAQSIRDKTSTLSAIVNANKT